MTTTKSADTVRAVLRSRTLGPSGLNPPQTEVINRLQTLTEDGPIADLDIDIWGVAMGVTQTDDRDPVRTREMVAEFTQWADAQGYTLRPAFEWRSTDSTDTPESQIVTPLITLAVYNEERLQAVYPHSNGDEINTVRDGIEALESRGGPGDTEQPEDEQNKKQAVPLQ
jgi:hypothetical protein